MNAPSHVEHEQAWLAARKRNILANAMKTWMANTERHEEILDALSGGRIHNDFGSVSYTDNFIGKMACAIDSYGKLTPNQSAAILKGIDASAARRAEWASKEAALKAQRQYIGEVGGKITVTLTVKHIVTMASKYGNNYLHICEDADQNIIIYKGTSSDFPLKGETATVTAAVKEHGVRNGVKQTVIQRPKKIS